MKFVVAVVGCLLLLRRSREGAWIEMVLSRPTLAYNVRRSREGAWIEIASNSQLASMPQVAPVRERGLKFSIGGFICER